MKLTINSIGKATKMPTTIQMEFTFISKDKDQATAINKGAKQILEFKEILKKLNISEETLETKNYRLNTVNKKVDKEKGIIGKEKTTEYVFSHYEWLQVLTIEFPYDLKIFSELISERTKISNPPLYESNFCLTKEEIEELEAESISDAILNANKKAEIIQKNLGMKNLEYVSMEYNQNFSNLIRKTKFNFEREQSKVNVDDLQNSLYPKKIEKEVSLNVIFEMN